MSGIKTTPQHEIKGSKPGQFWRFIAHINGKDVYIGTIYKHDLLLNGRKQKMQHVNTGRLREMPNDHFWRNLRTVLALKEGIT